MSSTLMTSGDPVVPDPLLALAGRRFPVATSSKRVSCTPPHRVGHGLDASMDWIGLGWIGLGRMLKKLGWIGLDWIVLRRMDDVILCYRWSKQVCLDIRLLNITRKLV